MALCIKCNKKETKDDNKLCSVCRARLRSEWKRKGIDRDTKESIYSKGICPECGKVFEKDRKQKYCSKSCSDTAKKKYDEKYFKSKKYIEQRKINRRTCEEDKRCACCNKIFQTNNKKVVCCSDKCKRLRQLEKQKEAYRLKKEQNDKTN